MFFKTSQMEILELKNMTLERKHSLNGHNRLERTRCSHRLQRQMSRKHLVWRQTGEVMGGSKRSLRDSQGSEKRKMHRGCGAQRGAKRHCGAGEVLEGQTLPIW